MPRRRQIAACRRHVGCRALLRDFETAYGGHAGASPWRASTGVIMRTGLSNTKSADAARVPALCVWHGSGSAHAMSVLCGWLDRRVGRDRDVEAGAA